MAEQRLRAEGLQGPDSLQRGRQSGGQASGELLCLACANELSAWFAVGVVADGNDGGEADAATATVTNAVILDIGKKLGVVENGDCAAESPDFGNCDLALTTFLVVE
jgi:hypothetical protein